MKKAVLIADWEGSVYQKWARAFCLKNFWRVSHTLVDIEDMMSECALQYVDCRKRYGSTVNHPKQFMYLFMRGVRMVINTLSTKDSKSRKVIQQISEKKLSCTHPQADVSAALSYASDELKEVLKVFLEAPKEILSTLGSEVDTPKQFFKKVVAYCKIDEKRSVELARELETLLD